MANFEPTDNNDSYLLLGCYLCGIDIVVNTLHFDRI